MNASARSEVLTVTHQLEDAGGNPRGDDAPQEVGFAKQSRRRDTEGLDASDECPFASFIDGAGI
jgi:hypothetical protein